MSKKLLPPLITLVIFWLSGSFHSAHGWNLNNKFGIHILEPTDLPRAAQLVNSSGGDWGYVTTVLRETDMDQGKWQGFFDDCRQRHLLPIVRLATQSLPEGYWAKPNFDDLEKWPNFLNQLNWPIKKQIVIIFNEPNHSREWGGKINPQEYALILDKMIALFKEKNQNFFILQAGLDQAAGNTKTTMDEAAFVQSMAKTVPGVLEKLDGWASHSYPNYGYVGRPSDRGRATIRGYEWELSVLKNFGLNKDLAIYITETGWPHREGIKNNRGFYEKEEVASFFQEAFSLWQKDDRVQAITPFVLNYPFPPFDNFSWLKEDGDYYPQFAQVLGISKVRAKPEQIQEFEIVKVDLPDLLPTDYLYPWGKIVIKNTGQWIMGEREDFSLNIQQSSPQLEISEIKLLQGEKVLPGKEITLSFSLKTGPHSAKYSLVLADKQYKIQIFKPWNLTNNQVSFWEQIKTRIKLWWLELQ